MSLSIPNIDDRNFDDLMTEAISLIPRYNREWTNFNPSDPGITMLELFAWLSESVLYTANQIPEATYWKYIDLLGLGRKEKTLFSKELLQGDLVVAGGEVRIVAAIQSDESLTLDNSFADDFERPHDLARLRPEPCPDPIAVSGRQVSGVNGELLAKLKQGDLVVIDGREFGVLKEKIGDDVFETFFPFSAKSEGTRNMAVLQTTLCTGRLRARGRHVMGEGTIFSELQPGDLLVADGHVKVVAAIESDVAVTVQVHFEEDINYAVDFFTLRPLRRTGTILTNGTTVIGNSEDEDLEAARVRAVDYVNGCYRAVTTTDYEFLVGAALKETLLTSPYRVVCLNNRNFEWGGIGNERPGHITAIIIVRLNQTYLVGGRDTKNARQALEKIATLIMGIVEVFVAEVSLETIGIAVIDGIEAVVASAITASLETAVDLGCNKAIEQGIRLVCARSGTDISQPLIENAVAAGNLAAGEVAIKDSVMEVVVECAKTELLEKLESFMDRRRILTTRVHAVFPRFRTITVNASLEAVKGVDPNLTAKEAREKIMRFFDPIVGDVAGSGWPLGRNLYRSEIYQVLEGVHGVDHVKEISINDSLEIRFVTLAEDELIDLIFKVTIKEV